MERASAVARDERDDARNLSRPRAEEPNEEDIFSPKREKTRGKRNVGARRKGRCWGGSAEEPKEERGIGEARERAH